MRLISRVKALAGALLLAGCLTQQAAAASFVGNRDDFRDETIYFVMTTRFYDGDKSNNVQCWDGQQYNDGDPAWRGDFKGLVEKLDYIKALGFTAIWITPVVENASGYDYHGYHASDFSKVDHRYESEDVTFKSLIDAAHQRGMKVILDIVLNHTGNFGEANLCKLFDRNWKGDQSNIDACMIPFTQKDGGRLPDDYLDLPSGEQYGTRLREMKNTDNKNHDIHNLWHHFGQFNWDDNTRWWAQIAGDCVDLNTENPRTANYLIDCYTSFIKMGVDGFRIDTGGHIARLTFNKMFNPAFTKAAETYKAARNGGPFFMFTEVCARYSQVWYREIPALSVPFYTWQESKDYAWDYSPESWDNLTIFEQTPFTHTNMLSCQQQYADNGASTQGSQPTSDNVFLRGNTYHKPDYSKYSGLSVIDFPMHHNFRDIGSAWGIARSGDKYYNDASYNVVYVDSHDYAPNGAPEDQRFAQGTDTWAENLSLMFTFRGIPCLYYGSEIEFKKGCTIDKGPNMPLKDSGRAYFGGYIKGDTKTVTDGKLTANCSGRGNMRIYVLNTALTPAPGKVGEDGKFLYGASPVSNTQPAYDGTQEELTDNPGGGNPGGGNPGGGSNPGEDIPEYTPQLSNGEMAVFFEAPADNSFKKVSVWCWSSTTNTNFTGGASAKWPGERATMMGKAANGNLIWKWTFTGTVDTSDMPTHIIFSNAGSPQTDDIEFKNGGYYTINGVDHVVTPTTSSVDGNVSASLRAYAYNGTIFVIAPEATTVTISSIDGRTFTQPVEQGENRIVGFGKGIYIVEGQKIIL